MSEGTSILHTRVSAAEASALAFGALYGEVASRLPGAKLAEVRAWRDTAMGGLARLGLPNRRVEEWKYTDLRAMLPEPQDLADHPPEALDWLMPAEPDVYRAVFVGGRFRPELSTVLDAPGVSFRPLREALNDGAGAAQAVARLPYRADDTIATLATVFATDGALIIVAPGTRLDKPLHLYFIAGGGGETSLHACRSAISLGEGADVTLIETHAGANAGQMFSALQLDIGAGATLRHLRFGETPGTRHLSATTAALGAGAGYHPVHFLVGGALTRAETTITFNGEGARAHFNGAMLLREHEHGDFTLVVDHAAPACESRETVKAVLDGEARGVFQAKVIVRPGAQKTDGRQLAHGLLLSDSAEFDAKPELEIYADDVKCNHGATSGALDDDMLFYLRSRGIPADEAKTLLILAFVGEIIDQIEDEPLREVLTARASQWLSSASANRA